MNRCPLLRKSLLMLALLCALCASVLIGCGRNTEEETYTAVPDSTTAAPSSADTAVTAEIPVEQSVKIISSSDFVTSGTSLVFAAEVQTADDDSILWSSSDPAVATVDENGVVTGISRGKVLITASTADGTASDSVILRVAKSGLIFLSPSRQTGNIYATGDTTECEQAFAITYIVEDILQRYGCEVYLCPAEPALAQRASIAFDMGAVCYVAIHSNAGSDEGYGTTALFHPMNLDSVSLAMTVYNEVADLTPTEETQGPFSGMGRNYAEIREPYKVGIPSTLLEVEYHDKVEQAQWIIDHHAEIADSIATGIMKWMSAE